MAATDSITVAVAARNEESGLAEAVAILIGVLRCHFEQYEVLLFDDGSTDETGRIADELASRNDHVKVVHHDRPHGLGGVIRAGMERARMQYFIWMDGKGATTASALHRIFSLRGQADLVIPFPTNQRERPLFRRIVSWAFQSLLNFVFRLNLRYYNHLVLCKVADALAHRSRSGSHAAQADMLVRMLRDGYTYVEVGVEDNFESTCHRSKALRLSNVIAVASVLLRLAWDAYVRRAPRCEPLGERRPSAMPET